ncbi:hypothetical protein VB716_15770 [Synechococcus sp. CCY9201]|jgi:hypothetical protein|uniref:hypothetical protein n=1 Tax=unclassified Synechococcus TaxID=2626047 RepID=UPI0018CD2D3D|nr:MULTISPECIES: hypothetical protein [unclassified Synechococcus]MEA5422430.1 hypothetical protein [Synechococcus sp. CCY9202]MEA5475676.1 hypothetical protein [Synechococcus sp. CCY9201]QPN61266.1 hypothetical protein H8F24_08535 [Synechococcus sp. CBW1002]QPN67003.1 hypothetical protein H8F26_01495 [Synechococcus sp. CBW1006]CAK6701163.1 hypothetical protein IFHNHDMJ_03021 [Synechococcus sp. CBW1107]
MVAIPDRTYNAACGRLASRLGVSLASARRKVDVRASQEGLRDVASKVALAERMLEEVIASGVDNEALLSSLLGAVSSEEYFLDED